MRVDCGPVRIRSREELDTYMNGSAAAVGRIMAPLLGCDEREDMAALGVAFQLTNFIRDVREDWTLDRVLPARAARGRPGPRRGGDGARERVAAEVARARALFARTGDLPERCERTMRPGMRMARAVYERVLDRVERSGFDVVRAGADLPPWEVARAASAGCAHDRAPDRPRRRAHPAGRHAGPTC
jgi:phytoene synthase